MADTLATPSLRTFLLSLLSGWAGHVALATSALYVVGYLVLRFHLTQLGVFTDLAVFDERYLFAGANFLIYMASRVPGLVMLAMPVYALGRLAWHLCPAAWRETWAAPSPSPERRLWVGVLWTVACIQLVMLQPLALMASHAGPTVGWVSALALDEGAKAVFFTGLLAAAVLSVAMLRNVWAASQPQAAWRLASQLLALLVGIQLLFLPIDFGLLVANKAMARVNAAGTRALAPGEAAWLAWEGKDTVTFLLCKPSGRYSLFNTERKQLDGLEVVGSDSLFALRLPSAACPTAGATP
ncbi:MAG: hypothetical protein RI907_1627 [Pseudomonadota bacterium]